ncbi:hypothetical protein FPQ18DRAFT_306981 [Pyronema domesticum]|nr:hypothetical protein FPQ18DRAFT_306981 [Pyronema domesticum]
MWKTFESGWDSPDANVKSIIYSTYTVIWEVLRFDFNDNSETPMKKLKVSVHVFEANIIYNRLFFWLLINLLFTLSGIMHIILQSTCSRPVIMDTAAVALTTDVSKLLFDPDVKSRQWRKMSYFTKQNSRMDKDQQKPVDSEKILLKLERGEDGVQLTRKND